MVQSLITLAITSRSRAQRLEKVVASQRSEIKDLKKTEEERVLEKFRQKVTPSLFKIFVNNLKNADRKPQGRRFPSDVKLIHLGMHQRSPKGYHGLPFIKPGRKTIYKVIKKMKFKPGMPQDSPVLRALAERAKAMSRKDRQVVAIFDEMALKVSFKYDSQSDQVLGFMDVGDGQRQPYPADEVLTCMIRSIYGKWKQVVGFWYTTKKMTAADFAGIFREAITQVLGAGLEVRVSVTDGLEKNTAAWNLLGVTDNYPFHYIEGRQIYRMCDPPHMLKSLANALRVYNLVLPDQTVVKFEYIEQTVRWDMQIQPRILKKITETNLHPNNFQKMNVPLQAQLYSSKVAAAIMTYSFTCALPPEAMVTGKFVERINDFFDSFNGVEVGLDESKTLKCAFTPTSRHLKVWEEMYIEMQGWKFIGSTRLRFQKNWISSTRALALLATDLQEDPDDFGPLPVGHINQDSQENFYSRIRNAGGHRTNPDVQAFPSAYGTVLINDLSTTSKGKNCRDDNALNLVHLSTLMKMAEEQEEQEVQCEDIFEIPTQQDVEVEVEGEGEESDEDPDAPDSDEDEDLQPPAPLATDEEFLARMQQKMASAASAQIAAPIVQAYLKKIECDECKGILLTESQFPLHIIHTYTANSDANALLPSQPISDLVTNIYSAMQTHMPAMCHMPKVLEKFVDKLKILGFHNFKLCTAHQEHVPSLLKRISCTALQDFILAMNQDVQEKKKRRRATKNKKLQHVSHM